MCRWLLVVFLTVASATGWAQPSAPEPAVATAKAQEIAGVAERRVAALLAQRAPLLVRYDAETRVIERLKQQKKTWNRERELKEKLAVAHETAVKLQNLERDLAAAQRQLASARTALVAAIDFELGKAPVATRKQTLERMREQLVPRVKPRSNVQRIAIPNLEVDPNADPEDLDAQAAELRQIEVELDRQWRALDKQSKDLQRADELRKSHERTIALDRREDNTPTRNPQQGGGGGDKTLADGAEEGSPSPQSPPPNTGGTGDTSAPPARDDASSVLDEASIALSEVIDPATIDTLANAQKSGDPGKRSKAAAKTRDAVKQKLELLRQKRALIEQRAKQLRK